MENRIKIIVFRIGTQFFCMEINAVEGHIFATDIGTMSSKRTISVNHNIVSVLDLHKSLKIPPLCSGENMYIVFSSESRRLAVLIDKVETVYEVPYGNLHSVPTVIQNGENGIFKNIVVLNERLIPLIETGKLFRLSSGADRI